LPANSMAGSELEPEARGEARSGLGGLRTRLRLAATGLLAGIALLFPGLEARASVEYPFLEYDSEKEMHVNGFAGANGVSSAKLSRERVTHTSAEGAGGALEIRYDVSAPGAFEFYFESLWGERHTLARNYLDRDDFFRELAALPVRLDRLDLWLRGSGATSNVHRVKVELKDEWGTTVHRYVSILDAETAWTEVQLRLDLNNWSGANDRIDPRRLDVLTFVLEQRENTHGTGSFFIDEVAFVDEQGTPLSRDASNDELLERISLRAFQYFLDWHDEVTGLWQDRSEFSNVFSAAATGFGLSALAVGDSRGWIDHDLAVARVKNTLGKLRDGQQAGSTPAESKTQNGYRGFYYHFLDAAGRREGASELSPIDTALLLMGVLHVREHFATDPLIVDLADALYQRVQWPWMLSASGRFHRAWSPDCGAGYTVPAPGGGCFTAGTWDYTTDEVILIDLLAIGSPTHGVPVDVFYAWTRERGSYGGYEFVKTWFGSLFTYFFAHEWIDFSRLGLDGHLDPAKRVDWHQNAIAAARTNHEFVTDEAEKDRDRYPAYGPNSWGLTAAEAPGPRRHPACSDTDPAYCNYGAPPVGNLAGPFHDGTIAPYGAAGMTMLVPDISIPALRHYYDPAKTDLWRERFGLADAYNLNLARWYHRVLFGIDEGPMLLGIDHYRGGTTRASVMRNPYIRSALCKVFADSPLCDTTPPETTIVEAPSSPTNDPTPTFRFTTEPKATFECRVVPADFAACTSPHTTAPLPDGTHTFEVRATDAAGNTDPSPASWVFRVVTVDVDPPETTIDFGPAERTSDRTPTFGFSADESGSRFECRLDGGLWFGCPSPFTTQPLAYGAHVVEVVATDPAGNRDPTPDSRRFTVVPRCEGIDATVDGLRGTPGPDVIVGRGGADVIDGRGGDDLICARDGSDRVRGGAGEDLLFGEGGDDALAGGDGGDRLSGGRGDDRAFGGRHGDALEGGAGDDGLHGQRGDDALRGGAGDDRLLAGAGDDGLDGGRGRDRCRGGPGRDSTSNCER
jgi:hypothetical protein